MNIKNLLIGILIGGMLLSCGGNKSKDGEGDTKEPGLAEAMKGLKNLNKVADAASDIEKQQKKLAEATPLTTDEMKVLLPETLLGMKRSSFTVGTQMLGINSGNANYTGDGDKSVELTIVDGAGETGASFIALYSMGLMMDREEQTESGFTKTTKINGHRAEVSESKSDDSIESKISLLVSDRYFVTLEGDKIDLKELEKALNELPLNRMK